MADNEDPDVEEEERRLADMLLRKQNQAFEEKRKKTLQEYENKTGQKSNLVISDRTTSRDVLPPYNKTPDRSSSKDVLPLYASTPERTNSRDVLPPYDKTPERSFSKDSLSSSTPERTNSQDSLSSNSTPKEVKKAKFCLECGTPASTGNFCMECGYDLRIKDSNEELSVSTPTKSSFLTKVEQDNYVEPVSTARTSSFKSPSGGYTPPKTSTPTNFGVPQSSLPGQRKSSNWKELQKIKEQEDQRRKEEEERLKSERLKEIVGESKTVEQKSWKQIEEEKKQRELQQFRENEQAKSQKLQEFKVDSQVEKKTKRITTIQRT